MQELMECGSQSELLEKLAHYRCESPLQIRVVVAGSLEPIQNLVARESPFPVRVRAIGDYGVGQFNYSAGDLRLHGTVFFCRSPQAHITYLISICSGTVWHRSILRLIHSLYPKLVPVFFSQEELLDLLKRAKENFPETDLRIVGHTRKKRLKAGSRRKYESSRTRTEKSLEAVFAETEQQNYWFSSINFEYVSSTDGRGGEVLSTAAISKYGTLFCTAHFDRFLYGTLNEMATLAEQKMKFFSNRSRLTLETHEPRPISITYDSPEFTSQKATDRFVGIMRKMTRTSCTVLHDNPYIHLSVVDSTDGSAADLWVLKNDEILLVPQLRASEAALKRFVNYIFEEWREGSVTSPTSDGLQPQEA